MLFGTVVMELLVVIALSRCFSQAVLTRLCGCDKLLQSLSIELAQLQADKVSLSQQLVHGMNVGEWAGQ